MRRNHVLFVAAAFLLSFALAQTTEIKGVPLEWQAAIFGGVTWLSAWLVRPTTALAKKWFNTTGPSTVVISAVLSTAAGIGFTIGAALIVRGDIPWWQAALTALLTFLKTNGAHTEQVTTTAKAIRNAERTGA